MWINIKTEIENVFTTSLNVIVELAHHNIFVNTTENGQTVKNVVVRGFANTTEYGQNVKTVVVRGFANTTDTGQAVKIVVVRGYANTTDTGRAVKTVVVLQCVTMV